jgi:ATP-binding cassette subfamily B (MDR/TAP) protein 1
MINFKLFKDMGPQNDVDLNAMRVIPFQNAIESLMYAMVCTRLDMAHEMGVVTSLWLILDNCIALQ